MERNAEATVTASTLAGTSCAHRPHAVRRHQGGHRRRLPHVAESGAVPTAAATVRVQPHPHRLR